MLFIFDLWLEELFCKDILFNSYWEVSGEKLGIDFDIFILVDGNFVFVCLGCSFDMKRLIDIFWFSYNLVLFWFFRLNIGWLLFEEEKIDLLYKYNKIFLLDVGKNCMNMRKFFV